MTSPTILRYPKAAGTVLGLISLLAGATTLVAADFGASPWVFLPLLVWLTTVGLPATLAVLCLAALWGTAAPLHGFGLFCILAAGLAVGAEVLLVKGLTHFCGGCHDN